MIYKFQPFSVTKELGKEYNAHCALVPNPEDWILILDYDCMVLHPTAYAIMEKAMQRYPGTEIFTACTNRVGYRSQRILGKMDKSTDLSIHFARAYELATMYQTGVCRPITTAAGFFLLFRKQYWMENPFQDRIINDVGKLFDHQFCLAAQHRGTIQIIQGVYLWHTYRITHKTHTNKDHLRK